MNDPRFFETILGVKSPWSVARVEMSTGEKRLDAWLAHEEGVKFGCPECAVDAPVYDHSAERVWRHLDVCEFSLFLHAALPRVECPEHGVRQARVPWADPRARFTLLMERWAVEMLRGGLSVSAAGRLLKLSWDELWHILDRAVARGLKRKVVRVIKRLGVDEKAIAKRHKYLTLVFDLERKTVEFIGLDREAASLTPFLLSLTPAQRAGIEAVALDMCPAYIRALLDHLPEADQKMVFDPFHVMKAMNEAVDKVRKEEHAALSAEGIDLLKKTKYWWLYGAERVPERHAELFEELRAMNLLTGRAWSIKETLRGLWDCATREAGEAHLRAWYAWAVRSRLEPVKRVARMIKAHWAGILNFFRCRVSNGLSEGFNGIIEQIKRMARGFRNVDHFITAIYFHLGGLDLCP